MSIETIITIIITIAGIILTPFIYIWKSVMQRIDKLEADVDKKIDKEAVRSLLEDKLEPMSKDLEETKHLLYKLLDLQLKK